MAKNLKLKLARVERDLTQGDLAEAVGVTRQTIGLIEAGKYNPSCLLYTSFLRLLRYNIMDCQQGGKAFEREIKRRNVKL